MRRISVSLIRMFEFIVTLVLCSSDMSACGPMVNWLSKHDTQADCLAKESAYVVQNLTEQKLDRVILLTCARSGPWV